MNFTENQVLEILGKIIHPAFGKSLGELNMINNLKIDGNKILFILNFPKPNDPLKNSMKKTCIRILKDTFGDETEISVEFMMHKASNKNLKPSYLSEVKNIIAIASGKGGVGKSTVAVNLAVAFASTGAKVGLLDADIFGPSVPKMLKAEHVNPYVNKVDGKDLIIPVVRYGVKTLSIGFFIPADNSAIWRGPMASNAFKQLLTDADWGELDYMFIDLPPGTSDIHLTLVQSIPVTGAVIVSTPQEVALADAIKGIHMFRTPSINVPILGLIENMAWFTPEELPQNRYYIFGREGCMKLSNQYGIPLLGQIPIIQSIRESGDNGEPVVLAKGPASEAYKTIADNLIVQLVNRNTNLDPTRIVEIKNSHN
jgi:ATP-binding protein involved in chromosome partitioning